MPLCSDCLSGVLLPGTPQGVITSLPSLPRITAYLASPPPSTHHPKADKAAVVLFTDIFGLPLGNPKILADGFARQLGVEVWVVDMFDGNPPLSNDSIMPYDHQQPNSPVPVWKKLGFLYHASFVWPKMKWGHNAQWRVYERMRLWVETLKREKGYEKIGAVGYCYGGSVILSLVPYHLLASAVICHPGSVDVKVVDDIDFPTSWVTCEEDFAFPPSLARSIEARFLSRTQQARAKGKQVPEYEFRKWRGTRHGFACRPALEVKEVREAFEGARKQTVGWLRRTLLEGE